MEKLIPKHVGIILDGNRRWAKQRHLPTFFGHAAGLKQAKKLIRYLDETGVSVVTLYAFSTENWKRSEKEVGYLMNLFAGFVKSNLASFNRKQARLRILGDTTKLPSKLKKLLEEAEELTKSNNRFTVQIAINYGGRDEIVRAVRKIIAQKNPTKQITEELISDNLDTNGIPDPDLIIRTSGEQRISNFLIWQSAYSEMYFASEYLPDFTEAKLQEVLDWYASRERRHGK